MKDEERIIEIIEKIIRDNAEPRISIGTYKGGGIETDSIVIPKEIIYKMDFLDKKRAIEVKGENESSGGDSHTHTWNDKSTYIEPLKDGDLIAYYRIDATRYIILGRVVGG